MVQRELLSMTQSSLNLYFVRKLRVYQYLHFVKYYWKSQLTLNLIALEYNEVIIR